MDEQNIKSTDNLLKLYALMANDEYELIKTLQSYLKFFSGILMAIIGGTLFLESRSSDKIITGISFIIGGVLVSALSYLGVEAAKSNYRRQLESIIKRFKIECLLCLDDNKLFSKSNFFKNEGFILPRYIDSMKPYENKTSKEFVDDKLKEGFMKVIRKFYLIISLVGMALVFIGIYILFK